MRCGVSVNRPREYYVGHTRLEGIAATAFGVRDIVLARMVALGLFPLSQGLDLR